MRNAQSVVIHKAFNAIGVGLLEQALEKESSKGCSPFLCSEPCALEPAYMPFDSKLILEGSTRLGTSLDDNQPSASTDYITFDLYPAEEDLLTIGWMETLLRALSVLRGTFAFELFGAGGHVSVRFGVPFDQEAGFRSAVLGHFPALRLRQQTSPFPLTPPAAVHEIVPVGPYHRCLTLLGREGASPLGIAASAIGALLPSDRGILQVLICPADPTHDWHYNVEKLSLAEERAAHLSHLGGLSSKFQYDAIMPPLPDAAVPEKVRIDVAFYAVVARYAIWSDNQTARSAFAQGMAPAIGLLRFGNRAFRTLSLSENSGPLSAHELERMVARRLTHRPGLMLTSQEVASLVHIPNARSLAMIPAFQQRRGLEWSPHPPDRTAPSTQLGYNEFAGVVRPVEIPMNVRARHTYVAGVTGMGKSKLIERMACDDAAGGLGFCLVDPHGDLCMDILSRLPEGRMPDLIYISFSEEGLVPRWNPLQSDLPAGKLADDITGAFLAQTSTSGPRMEHNFRMLAYTVHQLGGTLEDFAELAGQTSQGELLRQTALETIPNSQVQRFLTQELPKFSPSELASVRNKLSRILLDDQLGAMFRQKENSLHPREWMDEGKIVLVNLASGRIGADHAHFVGSLLISLIFRAALTRADIPEKERRPFPLYIDEFQELQAATIANILAEGRKYGLAVVLAHQERGQLRGTLAQAIGNAATKIIFRPTEEDYRHARRILGGSIDEASFRQLGVGEAFVASGTQVASLKTELTTLRRVRDPARAALEYAQTHYASVRTEGTADTMRPRRPRVYDRFEPDPDNNER